ncbi:MAG TPA: Gfo/Idh/MocA family oxidoreductase [Polyangiaceae bacterium]
MPRSPSRAHGTVRYAVVGLGNIAQVAILPAFAHARKNSELVALVSSDAAKLGALSRKYSVEHTGSYDDLESVLRESRADAVYIALPNAMHRSMTERAAAAGVHVLCEKPMATSVEDCEAMLAATRSAGVRLMIAYRLHFERGTLATLERVRAGEIGEPRIFSSVFSHQVEEGGIRTEAAQGGGALLDMGVYCVNAARHLFGSEPTGVVAAQGRGHDVRSREVDEWTSALLEFPGGRIAQLSASQGAADVSEYRIVGTRGDILLDPAYDYTTALEASVTVGERTTTHSFPRRDQFAPELLRFSEAILEGSPEPSGMEGLCDLRVIDAIRRAARTGRRVSLPPFHRGDEPDMSLEVRRPPVGKLKTIHAPSPSK